MLITNYVFNVRKHFNFIWLENDMSYRRNIVYTFFNQDAFIPELFIINYIEAVFYKDFICEWKFSNTT